VVDTVNPLPAHGGTVVHVNEDLNGAFLRTGIESLRGSEYQVRVESARRSGGPTGLFCEQLQSLANLSENPWRTLSVTVAHSISIYAENLQAKIKRRVGVRGTGRRSFLRSTTFRLRCGCFHRPVGACPLSMNESQPWDLRLRCPYVTMDRCLATIAAAGQRSRICPRRSFVRP
jgi:hypothetical protein